MCKAHKVLLAYKDYRVFRVIKVPKVPKVLQEKLVPKGYKADRVYRAFKV